jgi:hypothetical protein
MLQCSIFTSASVQQLMPEAKSRVKHSQETSLPWIHVCKSRG